MIVTVDRIDSLGDHASEDIALSGIVNSISVRANDRAAIRAPDLNGAFIG